MKIAAFASVFLFLTACSQHPPKEVEKKITDYFTGKMIAVYQFEAQVASPSQKFIEQYHPKETYCVTCQSGKYTLGSIAVITLSGDITIISPETIFDKIESEHLRKNGSGETSLKTTTEIFRATTMMARKAKETFDGIWFEVCPYPNQDNGILSLDELPSRDTRGL